MLTSSLLGLAAVAAATPLQSNRPLNRRNGWWTDDKEKFCDVDRTSDEKAGEVWIQTEAALSQEYHMRFFNGDDSDDYKEDDWLKTLVERFDVKGGDDLMDSCTNIDMGSCSISATDDCKKWFDDHEFWDEKAVYWVFVAVERMHEKMRAVQKRINEQTLFTGLDIGKMVDDLGGNEDADNDVLALLSGAFGLGSAVAGATTGGAGLSSAAGILGGILSTIGTAASEAADDDDEGVSVSDISSGLSRIVESANDSLLKMLRTAMGRPPSDMKYGDLPHFSTSAETDVGGFFAHGWWLLRNDEEAVFEALDEVAVGVKSLTAHMILRNAEWKLYGDLRVEDEDECGKKNGGVWRDAPGKDDRVCFYLGRKPHYTDDLKDAGEDLLEKMEEYGIGDLEEYYRHILDCAESDKDNKDRPDLSEFVGENGVPKCMFHMKATYADHSMFGGTSCGPQSELQCKRLETEDIE